MNQERRFDDLARTLANGQLSRGQILKLAGGALLGSVLGGFGLTVDIVDAEAKKKRRGKKKKRGKKKGRGSNTPPAVDSSDLPSAESIALARSLLAAGATDVPLSPAGYFSYHRALNGTFV